MEGSKVGLQPSLRQSENAMMSHFSENVSLGTTQKLLLDAAATAFHPFRPRQKVD
jgi:hypothetical protein